jgi:hypothetical protein
VGTYRRLSIGDIFRLFGTGDAYRLFRNRGNLQGVWHRGIFNDVWHRGKLNLLADGIITDCLVERILTESWHSGYWHSLCQLEIFTDSLATEHTKSLFVIVDTYRPFGIGDNYIIFGNRL